ncbi:hypothetical protein PYW07_008662 [Mythimna separata]|uniref:Uncharacterized protein n=1 Tax=Mythimna separata TaxID=271217 RepID=A0AAD8DN28_MYTSE|nr:hypothetical protein PYW07_008662 [Mythimna separata]
MCWYVTVALMLVNYIAGAPPPLRLTIDCSDERVSHGSAYRSSDYTRSSGLDVDSFCSLIHNAFPKTVQDGRFILIEPEDQTGHSDTLAPISIAPPAGFIPSIPKLKIPKLRIPSLNVPMLKEHPGSFTPPRIGTPMTTAVMRIGDESSAEKKEKFKKGVQKMLHVVNYIAGAPPPLRLTIDCSDERVSHGSAYRSSDYTRNSRLDVDSFCSLIHNAFPKTVQDGRFILIEPEDQTGHSDTLAPISIAPPAGFIPSIPKLKIPKLRIPSLNVPMLKEHPGSFTPPRIGTPMTTAVMRIGDESSAEKKEKFKKGVQKMLHVLGHIDRYLFERMRIIFEILTKPLLNNNNNG